jgi:DNA-directed RNA polymerase specialized sigma24 family protein
MAGVAGLRSLISILYRFRGRAHPRVGYHRVKTLDGPNCSRRCNFFWVRALAERSRGLRAVEGLVPYSRMVAEYLPFMRRYARALTGGQSSGDAYVAAALEAILADRAAFEAAQNPRVALYKVLTGIWSSIDLNDASDARDAQLPVERRLAQIARLPRQAFLLVSLEGFSENEAAEILGSDAASVRELVKEAGRELAAEIATDVLIIEDEALIAMDLERLVEDLGHRVIGVARTHSKAVSIAKAHAPGLILADIHLADNSSGLDAVNELLRSFEVPVIFITAYPERFLTGERPEPAFLIAKPFQPSAVSAVISQALFFERNARRSDRRATA